MLESYYAKPESADRLRALWLGPAIDRYAEWLLSRQVAKMTALGHFQILAQFNRFVVRRGVHTHDDLPAHIDAFVRHRLRTHKGARTARDRGTVRTHSRTVVEQLLRTLVPGFVGTV